MDTVMNAVDHTGSTKEPSVLLYEVQVQFCAVSLKNILSYLHYIPLSFILFPLFFTFTQWSDTGPSQEFRRGEVRAEVTPGRLQIHTATCPTAQGFTTANLHKKNNNNIMQLFCITQGALYRHLWVYKKHTNSARPVISNHMEIVCKDTCHQEHPFHAPNADFLNL